MTISGRRKEVPEMWQWQYLRAQEIARERMAEANDWRQARAVSKARPEGQPQPRWNFVPRGLRRVLPITE
jgi:hypothetical protein